MRPRFYTSPGRSRPHRLGRDAVALAARAGLELDSEQQLVLVESLRRDRGGRWRSLEVGVNEPRQNGKGGIVEGRKLAGVFLLHEPLQVYSSHQFDTSLQALERFEGLLTELGLLGDDGRPSGREVCGVSVARVVKSHGEEGLTFTHRRGRSKIRYRTRTRGGGRGFSADTVYLDEAMVISSAMHGALMPTLSGRTPWVSKTGPSRRVCGCVMRPSRLHAYQPGKMRDG